MRPMLHTPWLLAVTPLAAQSPSYPDLQSDWQRNREAVLAYIEAMPDSALSFRPTPGVRTFAEQFDHIVTTNLEVAAIALRGEKAAPAMADSSVYLHDKAALRRYAVATYDYLQKALQQAKLAQLNRRVVMYGPAASACHPAGGTRVRALGMDSGADSAVPATERRETTRLSHALLNLAPP